VTHSGPEVLFQDLRCDKIRGWWWQWWWAFPAVKWVGCLWAKQKLSIPSLSEPVYKLHYLNLLKYINTFNTSVTVCISVFWWLCMYSDIHNEIYTTILDNSSHWQHLKQFWSQQ